MFTTTYNKFLFLMKINEYVVGESVEENTEANRFILKHCSEKQ